ncbi:hypothetical protein GIW70_18855 [Pseudomonas syringae]|nr:hypothetical protein [Pseudomonas syringae]MCF5070251.1 hypothetical protein [Pseudomonas syringae]
MTGILTGMAKRMQTGGQLQNAVYLKADLAFCNWPNTGLVAKSMILNGLYGH